jgi:hypothetical protein
MVIKMVRVPGDLLEEARKALGLGDDIVAVAIVRKALIDAIGDDNMEYEVKRGRPPKSDA